jgi:hypothetical protein
MESDHDKLKNFWRQALDTGEGRNETLGTITTLNSTKTVYTQHKNLQSQGSGLEK